MLNALKSHHNRQGRMRSPLRTVRRSQIHTSRPFPNGHLTPEVTWPITPNYAQSRLIKGFGPPGGEYLSFIPSIFPFKPLQGVSRRFNLFQAVSRLFQKKKIVYFFRTSPSRLSSLCALAFKIRVHSCPSVVENQAGNQGNQTDFRPLQTKKFYRPYPQFTL
jgi:hypothetical protein